MLGKLFLLFVLIPMAELFLLVWIADKTSIWATLALVIGTGMLGSFLAKQQGFRVWMRCRDAFAKGQIPARDLQDGILIAFAAALLLTPGVITDTFGLLLMLPMTRAYFRRWMVEYLVKHVHLTTVHAGAYSPSNTDDRTVDAVTIREVDAFAEVDGRCKSSE